VYDTVAEIYSRLLERFGPQHWWPGDSPFEVMVGAVLVQNTNWKNVERAIANLREQGLLAPDDAHAAHKLAKIHVEELAELVRPAGYYRQKARRLHNLAGWFVEHYEGSFERLAERSLDELRIELLSLHGIGRETADSILLYALARPTFVVDSYTHRVLARHGWIDETASYDEVKDYFESALEPDATMFNEYHALLVELGKVYCRKQPQCDGCPLESMLPEGGPHLSDV
jgi:endonuclease-3 related protein